jgi:hypothetical protein
MQCGRRWWGHRKRKAGWRAGGREIAWKWADEKKLRQALKIDPIFVPII